MRPIRGIRTRDCSPLLVLQAAGGFGDGVGFQKLVATILNQEGRGLTSANNPDEGFLIDREMPVSRGFLDLLAIRGDLLCENPLILSDYITPCDYIISFRDCTIRWSGEDYCSQRGICVVDYTVI